MRVISKGTLRAFWLLHADAEEPLAIWHREVIGAKWRTPQDVKDCYRTASFLAGDRVVFNIKGNKYRLVVHVIYKFQTVYIRFVGTHAQYDTINANTV